MEIKKEDVKEIAGQFIIKEQKMPYVSEYNNNGSMGHSTCSRVSHCSCDCNYIACPIFMG